jgi:hypothetical protein
MRSMKQSCIALGSAGLHALAICADARRQRDNARHQRRAGLRAVDPVAAYARAAGSTLNLSTHTRRGSR